MSSFHEKIFNAVSDIAASTNNPFKDKWVSILGDSISTYEGYIPEGNSTWYPNDDVDDVSKTWWHLLLTKLGAKLCVNESWGGRKVCGSDTRDAVNVYNKLHRVKGQTYINLDGSTEVATEDIQPDIILLAIGINDFLNGSTLGTYSESMASNAKTDFYSAYNFIVLRMIGTHYKNAQTYCLNTTYTHQYALFGKNANGNNQLAFNKAIQEEANLYGVHFIDIFKLCVHGGNRTVYLIDDLIHPKAAMMTWMANQCYSSMMAENCL